MSASTGPAASPPSLLRSALRFALLVAILGTGLALFRWTPVGDLVDGENLLAWLEILREAWWTAPTLVLLWCLLGPIGIPVSGLVLAGGAVFGVFWGWLYNLIGVLLSAAISHLLARYLGRELIAHVLGQRRVERMESLVSTHGFWTLVRVRFLPVPFVAVNYGAALAGMPLGRFLATTAIGCIPALFVWSYFTAALVQTAEGDRSQLLWQLVLVLLLFLGLTFVPTLLRPRRAQADSAVPTSDPGAETKDPTGS